MAPNYGTFSSTSPNGVWTLSTRKQPILKAGPIEQLHQDIGIPIPEMIFGDNFVSLTHNPSHFTLFFNARDAMDRVSKTEEGMLQVAVADEWKETRKNQADEVKEVVKPFDWSYSTDYKGTSSYGHPHQGKGQVEDAAVIAWKESDQQTDPIRTDLLSRQDPIQFFDTVDLYEDELADNGIALLNIKVRMMPERLLILSRYFLRLDGVIVRIRDTRVYVEHSTKKIIRQYTSKEEKYEVVAEKLKGMRENVPEAFRDVNKLAPILPIIEDLTDVFEVD